MCLLENILALPIHVETPCTPLKVSGCFGGACHLHQKASIAASFMLGSLFGLLFNLEDGGDMFLRIVGCLSTNYTASYPTSLNSSVRRMSTLLCNMQLDI
jgi:hypothetical protein